MPNDVKFELELTSQDDGEFWMCFRDFCREYCNMIICNLSPDFDHDGVSDKAGKSTRLTILCYTQGLNLITYTSDFMMYFSF